MKWILMIKYNFIRIVPEGLIENIPLLFQMMGLRGTGHKPLFEPTMSWLTEPPMG